MSQLLTVLLHIHSGVQKVVHLWFPLLTVSVDLHFTEGTLMMFKVVHLCFKKLRLCYERSASACNHFTCCEQFAVGRGSLKMVPVDTETRRNVTDVLFSIHSVVHKFW